MFIASPVVAMLCQRFPRKRRLANYVGLAVLTGALVAASFTNTTGALLATQGVLFAIGGLTMYFPAMYVIGKSMLYNLPNNTCRAKRFELFCQHKLVYATL